MIISKIKLFWHSSLVFIILNFIENIIHYSIGKNYNKDDKYIKFEKPSSRDMVKILIIMFIFAILQGLFTCIIESC
jgi:hypothetical protein